MKKHGPYLKFSPPMHEEPNRKELWKLLAQGFVDTMGSDHCPYTDEEKKRGADNIWLAPNGIPGLQAMLPVLLDGVNKGLVTLEKVVEVTSYNPAQIYGLAPRKGLLQPGSDADFVVLDMNLQKTMAKEENESKCPWSPYFGMTFKGWPVMTVLRGELVYKNGKIVGKCGYGKYVPRPK
jgi:dihydroorotase-like cyclic amidohydrolase